MRYIPSAYGVHSSSMRLAALVGMLVVLGMVIMQASNPQTWRALASDSGPSSDEANPKSLPSPVELAAKNESDPSPEIPPVKIVTPTGPTDLDPDEWDAALEEFGALEDNSLDLDKVEMPAYWRLLGWSKNQTIPFLRKRASEKPSPSFHDLIRNTNKVRGQLACLKLNVRRVLECPAPENSEKIEKVYEIWGFTEESQAWLYCFLASELPPDMPVGLHVNEQVTAYGYFLKLQGYLAAGAKPNAPRLKAPLFLGRIEWRQSPLAVRPKSVVSAELWLVAAGAMVAILVVGMSAYFLLGWGARSKSRNSLLPVYPIESGTVESWLDDAIATNAVEGRRTREYDELAAHLSGDSISPPPGLSGDPSTSTELRE